MLLSFLSSCNRLINRGIATNPRKPQKGNTTTQPSSSSGSETALLKQAGTKRYYLNVNGDNRTFLVQLPKGYSADKTYPVVFFFHGINGRDTGWQKNLGATAIVDKYQYIAVYGQGANGGVWNIGGNYPYKTVNEPDFVKAMYNWLGKNTNIDTKRIYAMGQSNGGLLIHYLAIQTGIFAAIAPVAGSLYTDEMKPGTTPTAVFQIHGEMDKTIPYNGGYTPYKYTFLSAKNSVMEWAKINGCNAAPTASTLLNGKVEVLAYTSCSTGKQTMLYSLPNIPHKVLQIFEAKWIFEQAFDFFAKNTK